jgi:23S rRNA (guanosine2251-2'-O)-methyltransferase
MIMILYGRNIVLTALENRRKLTWLKIAANVKGDVIKKIKKEAENAGIEIKWVPPKIIDKITTAETNHQGIVCKLEDFEYLDFNQFLENKKTDKQLVILDQITDPHNLGAIIRTAEAAGFDALLLPKGHSAKINATVFKTSAGAAFNLPIVLVDDLKLAFDLLKKYKFKIFGLAGDAEKNYTEIETDKNNAIVIGSEGQGLRKIVRNNCSDLVKIPMNGKSESLNASVSAAVVMYSIAEKRGF